MPQHQLKWPVLASRLLLWARGGMAHCTIQAMPSLLAPVVFGTADRPFAITASEIWITDMHMLLMISALRLAPLDLHGHHHGQRCLRDVVLTMGSTAIPAIPAQSPPLFSHCACYAHVRCAAH